MDPVVFDEHVGVSPAMLFILFEVFVFLCDLLYFTEVFLLELDCIVLVIISQFSIGILIGLPVIIEHIDEIL